MIPTALAAGASHGPSHEPASGSGSEKKSGGGGVGSTLNKVTCGAQNVVNRVTLGFFGSPCSSSSGSADPVQATSSILKQTFGGLAVAASPLLAGTLTQVPDFAAQSGGVVTLERSTTAIGFAVAALVLTLSILRFVLAGASASGGFEGAEGLTRTVVAALAIVAWPWAFHNLAALMNTGTHALLSTHAVHVALLGLVALGGLGAVLFATHSKIGWIFGIVILGLEALLMIGLLLMKVLLAGATTLIFVAMPLALALWPLRETAWIARRLAHVLFVAVATPLMWALIFATAAVMGGSVFGLQGGFWDTVLVRPLAAMSMFVLALLAPLMLLRHSHAGMGHPVGRLAGYMSMRMATNAVSAQIPVALGGRRQEPRQPSLAMDGASDVGTGGTFERAPADDSVNGDQRALDSNAFFGPVRDTIAAAATPVAPGVSHELRDGAGAAESPVVQAGPDAVTREGAGSIEHPAEDAPRFSLRDPATLSFADSLATERLKARAAQGQPGVAEGRAALEAFAPGMVEQIQSGYHRAGQQGQPGTGEVDAAGFRATMAASALSEEISSRQADALLMLAGIDDAGLSALFAGMGDAPAKANTGMPTNVTTVVPSGAPDRVTRAGDRGEEVPRGRSTSRLASFQDDLSDSRPALLVAEQPGLPPGAE